MGKIMTFDQIKQNIEERSECKVLISEDNFLKRKKELDVKITRTPIDLICKCGNLFQTHWNQFNSKQYPKHQCNECGEKIRRSGIKLSFLEVKNYINGENGNGCLMLSEEYKGVNETIKIQCRCLNEFETTFTKFKDRNKRRCNECSIENMSLSHKLTYDEVKNRVEKNNEYNCKLLSTEYKDIDGKLKLQCNCGEIFYRSLRVFEQQKAYACGKCSRSMSKGEITTDAFLKKHNINYEYQFSVKNCMNKKTLRFDFAILDANNNLEHLIEIDGEQHYKSVKHFGGKTEFKQRKKRDEAKNLWCRNNNISLIRIPYYMFDKIDDILNDEVLIS